jgi:hypothetical protein
MNDHGAFLVRNILEATSEELVRMPIFAVFLSFTGAIANAIYVRGRCGRVGERTLLSEPLDRRS